MILNLYKQRGETPLECIKRYRKDHPEFKDEKFTYLGRLDPMAEGVLLVGTAEDTKEENKQKFLHLDKVYEFVVLFGFATDSFDALGKIMRVERLAEMNESELYRLAEAYVGKREQKYPPYSSKPLSKITHPLAPSPTLSEGESKTKQVTKPLHEWARMGEINGDELPTREIEIYSLKFEGLQSLSPKELFGRLLMDISKVQGDFRQNEVLIQWKNILVSMDDSKVFLGKFVAHVSSGTYIRSLANEMGKTLGCGALALSIKRTKVGEWGEEGTIK